MAVSTLPGPKPTPNWSDQIMAGLNAFGRYERQRQDMQMRDAVMQSLTAPMTPQEEQDPSARWNRIVGTVASFKPSYGQGLAGAFQRFGNAYAEPSQYGNQIADLAVSQVTPEAQAKLAETQAQAEYYKQPRNAAGGLFARDPEGNMRPLRPGETPLEGETVVRPSARAETDPDVRRQKRYESAATIQAALETATDEKDRAWLRKELDRMQQDEEAPSTRRIETANMNTGEISINGQPTGRTSPEWPGNPDRRGQPAPGQRNGYPQVFGSGGGLAGFGNGVLAGFSGGDNGNGGNTNPQPFGSGGGLAAFGNGVAGGLSVGSWGGPGQQTPSGVSESGRSATVKAQEGGGVIVTNPRRNAAPVTPAPAQPTGQVFRQKSTGKFFQLVGYDNKGNPLYREVQ